MIQIARRDEIFNVPKNEKYRSYMTKVNPTVWHKILYMTKVNPTVW
jgi:hypothetical protein